ncbi:MAG: methylase involved in ubiquinone/menaquinone biosynthesis [Methanobacterium sp. Maddingley MBC34]|nr:MAG: methylase involved in ubiquinone/menaquinone biosynthesis [Methanobacterium sp. Maddingley MBC34]
MDSEENFEYVECNLCGSKSSDIFFKGKDIKYKKNGLFTVVKCKECGLIYINPRPKQTVISSYYPDEYWEMDNDNGVMEAKIKQIAHRFINKISYKMTIPPKKGGKILDIGCGDGKGLLKLKEEGWETYGVEISDLAAKYVREKYGLNVFTGIVEDAGFEDEFFDAIILSHVIEHLSDPKTTLTEVNRILKNDGMFTISLPNVASFEAKYFKKYWIGWDIPRHFYYFTPITIKSLLDKTGFDVLTIKYDNNPNNILSSLKYFFIAHEINPLFGLACSYPFANLTSIILGKSKRSDSMAIYSKKRDISS